MWIIIQIKFTRISQEICINFNKIFKIKSEINNLDKPEKPEKNDALISHSEAKNSANLNKNYKNYKLVNCKRFNSISYDSVDKINITKINSLKPFNENDKTQNEFTRRKSEFIQSFENKSKNLEIKVKYFIINKDSNVVENFAKKANDGVNYLFVKVKIKI